MDFLKREVGGRVRPDRKEKPYHKDRWYWRINGFVDVYTLLKSIEPFLAIKRKQALEVLKMCEKRLKEVGYL